MRAISEALFELTQVLVSHQITNPRRQAEELLCDVLSCDRFYLHVHGKQLLNESEWRVCQERLIRRLRGEPLAYIHGRVDFYQCSIRTTSAVLIPRPETEILVDKIVQELSREDLKDKVLWDICCGSGCMGIALKKRFPSLRVVLADCSPEALRIAAQNAEDNQVEVLCLQGDLLEPLQGQKAHFVVCNPPYISEQEFERLDPEVREFEPRLALLGGVSGLEFYERLACDLVCHLYPHAKIWLEIGYDQGRAVQTLFKNAFWKNQRFENDWAGHNRFFFLENE